LLFDADGRVLQNCSTSGEVQTISERYQRRLFEYETEWPVRMAVVREHGVLTHMVLVILHTAIDAYGLTALLDDIAARDPETGQAPPVTAMQPLEQARFEASPAGRRQNAASLRYLERVLRSVPAHRFGPPLRGGEPEYHMIHYRSPATLLAIRAVADRHRTNTSPVLLAAFAVALARFTGINPVVAMLTVSNRFRPGLGDSVSKTTQLSPYLIDVAGLSLDGAVAVAERSAMSAYKNAAYHPDEQDEVIERVERDRGERIDLECFYNDRRQRDRGQAGDPVASIRRIRAALPLGEVRWKDEIGMPRRTMYFNVDDPPGAIEFNVSMDTRYFTEDDMVAIVRGVEAVTVEAAQDGSTPTGVGMRAEV
jgi:hypothetical protein